MHRPGAEREAERWAEGLVRCESCAGWVEHRAESYLEPGVMICLDCVVCEAVVLEAAAYGEGPMPAGWGLEPPTPAVRRLP